MVRVIFVGAYAYARQVYHALPVTPALIISASHGPRLQDLWRARRWAEDGQPGIVYGPATEGLLRGADLVVVAGWRQMVPIVAPTVGFHSAKLPEYPGRAPVANAILRGDASITNTMLWLDEGVDTGDIIDEWEFPITGRDPSDIYAELGETSALMLQRHWRGLLDGFAPRRPQDMSRRGPLTPADAWGRL